MGQRRRMAFSTSERFAALDAKDRDRLEALSKLDEFEPGEEILVSGHAGDWVYLIASGGVDVRARGPSGEVTLARLGPGDVFGELEAFAHPRAEILRHVARQDTIVRAINKHPLVQEMKLHRSLATGLLYVYCRSLSEKLRSATELAMKLAPPPAGFSRPPPPGGTERAPHLSADEAAWLKLLGQRLSAEEGETVVVEGDTARSFYVIDSGEVEVRKRIAGGADRALQHLGPRDMFGFMSFVDGRPRSASVVTLAPSRLVRVDPDALEKAIHLNFTVGFKFLGTLCGVLGRTFREMADAILTT